MAKPRIIVFDLETSLNILTAFQLLNKNAPLPYKGILQERYIICGSYKILGASKVSSISVLDDPKRFKKSVYDDFHVVKELHKVLSEADAVIAHYGDAFDMKFLNSRVIFHGLKPLPNIIQIDTWKIAKNKFLFNSNRLDYLGQFLKVGEKIHTESGLWLRCLNGDKSAIKQMVKYNRGDITLLEKVYNKLSPFISSKINYRLFNEVAKCAGCGSENIQYRGYTYTKLGKYKRYQCIDCGQWDKDRKAIK